MKPKIYHNDWAQDDWEHKKGKKALESDFEITLTDSIDILFAAYTYENYSGNAFILFKKGKLLYEVNGNHCSCNGLEGQWEPERTSIKALEFRLMNGSITENSDIHLAKTLNWLKKQ